MGLGLESSPRLTKLRLDESRNMKRVHDRCRSPRHIGGGLLEPGESVHSDVLDSVLELIELASLPIAEGHVRAAGDHVE